MLGITFLHSNDLRIEKVAFGNHFSDALKDVVCETPGNKLKLRTELIYT